MRRGLWAGLVVAGLGVAGAALAQTPTVAPPLIVPDPDRLPGLAADAVIFDQVLEAACDGRPVQPLRAEAPAPSVTNWSGPGGRPFPAPADSRLTFSIDERGLAHAIRRPGDPQRPTPPVGGPAPSDPAAAALMGWRFEPGVRADCTLTIRSTPTPLDQAPETLKARALALAPSSAPWRAGLFRAMERPGDDCRRRPGVRTAPVGPNAAPPPGGRAWAALRFDVDADGRTTGVEVIGASDDPEAVEALRGSVAATTYHPGRPAKGCIYASHREGEIRPAESMPMPDWRPLNRCTPEQRARLTLDRLDYPEELEDRQVEGWALVRFDLASWGRIGGLEVLASEPVPAFGDQARSILQRGRVTPGFKHAAGCVDRVIFRLPDADEEAPDAE